MIKGRRVEMARAISLTVVICLLRTAASSTDVYRGQLRRQFFALTEYSKYDASRRPFPDPSGGALPVEVDVVMVSVGPVNSMDMTWTTSFYLRQEWTDPRLILNASETHNRIHLVTEDHVHRIWRPDIFFSNSKDDRKHDITVPNQLIYINVSTGHILFSQRLTVTLNCEMRLEKFPHDNQNCDLFIDSYGYTTKDVVLKWSSSRSATDVLPTTFIPDFTIDNIVVSDCTATYATGTFPCLKATIHLHREIGYYVIGAYIPTVLIVILSWASFWIDHEAVPARISVGLLTVLTITTQLSGSRAQLPRVPYIKAIDVWMSTNLVFVFAAYMEYALVTVLSRKYKKAASGRRQKASDSRCTTDPQVSSLHNDRQFQPPSHHSASQHGLDQRAENGDSRQRGREATSAELPPASSTGPAGVSRQRYLPGNPPQPSAIYTTTTQTAVFSASSSRPPAPLLATAASSAEVLSRHPKAQPTVLSEATASAFPSSSPSNSRAHAAFPTAEAVRYYGKAQPIAAVSNSAASRSTASCPPTVEPTLDQKNTGRRVDKCSQSLFPISFIIFNVIYWVYYLELAP